MVPDSFRIKGKYLWAICEPDTATLVITTSSTKGNARRAVHCGLRARPDFTKDLSNYLGVCCDIKIRYLWFSLNGGK